MERHKFEINEPKKFEIQEEPEKKFEITEPEKKKFLIENPGVIYMEDLYRIGPEKPMGYLPLNTLGKFSDRNEEELTKYLNERGALFAYHPKALQKLLDTNRNILEKYNWPTSAREFVLRVASQIAEPGEIYGLIADAFGNPNRTPPHRT